MQRKVVYQYDKDLNLIQVHESVTAAAESGDFLLSGISNAARDNLKSHGGYVWSYKPINKKEVESV